MLLSPRRKHPFLVESPRWLLTKGRVSEAAEIINNIRKFNKQEPVRELEEKLRPIAEQENQQARDSLGPLDIFKNFVIFRYSPHAQEQCYQTFPHPFFKDCCV